jgi:hypothetical protein
MPGLQPAGRLLALQLISQRSHGVTCAVRLIGHGKREKTTRFFAESPEQVFESGYFGSGRGGLADSGASRSIGVSS